MGSDGEPADPEPDGDRPPPRVSDRINTIIDAIADAPGRDAAELRRLRIITATLLSIVVVASLAALSALVLDDPNTAMSSFGGVVLSALVLVFVSRGASSAQASHALGGMLTALIFTGTLLTEGMLGPGPFSLLAVPVLLTLALGGRAGWAWCGIVAACDVVLALATDGDAKMIRLYALSAILDAVVLTACAHAFDVMRRRALAEANEARVRAEAAAEAKSRFLANMSHEIRTPMNGVLGMLGLLLDSRLEEGQQEYAELAHSSGVTLLDLLNDILDVSKLEAGQVLLEASPFDPRRLVEEVLDQVAVAAEPKDVAMAVDLPDSRALVGDHGRIRQVLLNLVSNAVKFTERGHVLISMHQEAGPEGVLQHRFAVQDTGIGIPVDRHADIFEQFQQVDMSTTRAYGGTGLGLAIVKDLVELMGGTVGLDSEPGRGSTFWFTLPLTLAEPDGEPPPRPAALAGLRVLVVDDHHVNRRTMSEQLTALGMRPAACESGREALERLREAHRVGDPFSLVLVDQAMPGMDGMALCRRIEADEELRDAVRVLLCGLSQRATLEALAEAGVAAHLTKPVHHHLLVEALVGAWAKHRGEAVAEASQPAPGRGAPLCATRVRVLVVEDNAVNQKVAQRMLERFGCHVDVASDGEAALELTASVPYDLVFMDVQMPVMDGLTATIRLREREHGTGQRLHVVAMTAHVMEPDRQKCFEAGMDDYVSKPVRREELARVLGGLEGRAPQAV